MDQEAPLNVHVLNIRSLFLGSETIKKTPIPHHHTAATCCLMGIGLDPVALQIIALNVMSSLRQLTA